MLDVVLRCRRRSKSTGTHSQHASLFGVHRSRRVARRCNPLMHAAAAWSRVRSGPVLQAPLPRGRCKMTTHHKACTLPAVPSSRSKPASLMFRQNSQCNRRLTCSPKRVDLTNHKRLAVYTCANRDVFA